MSLPPAKFDNGVLTRCIGMSRSSAGKRASRSGANGLAAGLGSTNERPGLATAGVAEAVADGDAIGDGEAAATGVVGVDGEAAGCAVQPAIIAVPTVNRSATRTWMNSECCKEPVRMSGAQSERGDDVVA